jgi:anthranilate phosphoribosyltransferase
LDRAHNPEIALEKLSGPALDVCGTGGDRLDLFNISTTAMFILAAGGVVVVKHGNRAITSQCGGADVLEELGVRIDGDAASLRECLQTAGVGFLFAPSYHPAFRVIGPVRKALAARGVSTIFNLLGPLLNPVKPPYQLVGVYSSALLPTYATALQQMGRTRAWAVHGQGADELTCAGKSEVLRVDATGISRFDVHPETLGLPLADLAQLKGGGRETNARLLLDIVSGVEKGAPADAVLLNAAAGFVIAGVESELGSGLERARRAIRDGRALCKVREMVDASQSC